MPDACTQRTITLPGQRLARLLQALPYASHEWSRTKSRVRSMNEGKNADTKDGGNEGLGTDGRRAVAGRMENAILAVCSVVATNLRLLRTFLENATFIDGRLTRFHGNRPRRPYPKREKTKTTRTRRAARLLDEVADAQPTPARWPLIRRKTPSDNPDSPRPDTPKVIGPSACPAPGDQARYEAMTPSTRPKRSPERPTTQTKVESEQPYGCRTRLSCSGRSHFRGRPWVELRGLEPLTPSLRTRCATSCATAPWNGNAGYHRARARFPRGSARRLRPAIADP